ncbi:hypothetical protein MBLNU457_3884t2 [Dothideomycetes sp. NU457]
MFSRAVAVHDASGPKHHNLSTQTKLPSSSPAQQESPSARKHPQNLGNNILSLKNSTALNSANKRQFKPPPVSGIKRTANGLGKVLGDTSSFEVTRKQNSRNNPIAIDENSPVKTTAPPISHSEFFNEDDFSSDIDLDIEDPSTKQSVKYPTLPKAAAAPSKPFYPTLPKLQDVRTYDSLDKDSGYGGSVDLQTLDDGLDSSMPLSWPSSPPEHKKSLSRFAYTGRMAGTKSPSKVKTEVKVEDVQPVKRRTLPWVKDDSQTTQAVQNGPPLASHMSARTNVDSTPMSKDPKKSSYPWNTTASAIKEQQKTLREVNKKKSKYNEAQDQAVEIVRKKQGKDRVARVFLSEEQQHILDLVVESKRSVFFTGSAGTGKSVLLREIISTLRKKHVREPDRVAVTASTGLAACNIGGVTLHSFAGIGLGKEDVPELVKKIRRNQKAKQRWQRTKILIVDEVSMVDGDLFDKLEAIARQLRNNGRPFGGIQLVITGDFFQLPPVPDSNKVAKFAFDAASWNTSIQHTIGLHHVFRQKDPVFAGMLNEMREGRLSQSSIAAFHKLSRPLEPRYELAATELFPTRNEVEAANKSRMDMLVGDTKTFEARDGGTIVDKAMRDKLLANCMAPEFITLKKGAQVMLIKNIDESLVNGSVGKVIGFMSEQTFDKYSSNEDIGGSVEAVAEEDDVVSKKLKAAGRIMDNLLGSTTMLYPVVRFTLADNTTRDLLCQRESWKVELPNGEVQASRSQVPLILAWALSIHKAQGQTLERVKVDLGKVFEKGQAYVALSRATTMAGLQVLRFDPKKVNAHEKVRNFYQQLSRVETLEKTDGANVKKRKAGFAAEEYEKEFLEG